MNNNRFFDRIDFIDDIDVLAKKVCKEYSLGDYRSIKIIEIGYEDFNAIITSASGNYFLKIFSNLRTDEDAQSLVERVFISEKNGIRSPKIYRNSDGNIITTIQHEKSKFRLCLMQYIEGNIFYELKENASDEELLKISDLAGAFGNIDYKPKFIYDTWAITSFIQEFERKKQYIDSEHLEQLQPIYNRFKEFDYNSLPKSFTHGDIILTNIIKDNNSDLWLVDYSVSNYTARLNEIVVASNDFALILNDKIESERRIKLMFERWASKVNATEFERKSFEMLYRVQNAIYTLIPLYEISKGNNSDENKMFLELGQFGLTLDVNMI